MSCPNTHLLIHSSRKNRNFMVRCGHCLDCLTTKINQVAYLANREFLYQWTINKQNSTFTTLTYRDSSLPLNNLGIPTLRKKDAKDFMKRFRMSLTRDLGINPSFKVIYSGEYGEDRFRPHMHFIFLGLNESIVASASRSAWSDGIIDIGPLGAGGIRYVCKYIDKQDNQNKDVSYLRSIYDLEDTFFYHSVKLGFDWILQNIDRIIQNNFQFYHNQKICFYPKYVLKLISNLRQINYSTILASYYRSEARKTYSCFDLTDLQLDKLITLDRIDEKRISDFHKINALVQRGKQVTPELLSLQNFYRVYSQNLTPSVYKRLASLYSGNELLPHSYYNFSYLEA